MTNLAMNLCAYRKLYEEHPEKYQTIKAAIGYGIGEVRVSAISEYFSMLSRF